MANLLMNATGFFAIRTVRLSLLITLILGMLATFAWQATHFFAALNNQAVIPETTTKTPTVSSPENKPDGALLHLFGAQGIGNDLKVPSLEKLPESNLNLQVSAIFSMARPENSSVILEDGDRTMILKPGEEARPGIVVQAIESHRITLKRNGKIEQISFKGFGEMPSGNSIPSQPPATREVSAASEISQNNDKEVIAQASVGLPPAAPMAVDQNLPTAYQQYIQRKLAQNK